MSEPILRLGSLRDVSQFLEHVRSLALKIHCDAEVLCGAESALLSPIVRGGVCIGNRITVQPMEGWDGTADGRPSELTIRRWQRFGQSGAKLIWGGEAVAVCHEGRANPNQLVMASHTREGLARLSKGLLLKEKRYPLKSPARPPLAALSSFRPSFAASIPRLCPRRANAFPG